MSARENQSEEEKKQIIKSTSYATLIRLFYCFWFSEFLLLILMKFFYPKKMFQLDY